MSDLHELRQFRSHLPEGDDTIALGARRTLLRAACAPRPRRQPVRRTLVFGCAALVVAGGGVAYAVVAGQAPVTALKVNCAVGVTRAEFTRSQGFTGVLDTISGDPVADCTAEYNRLEPITPKLQAYSDGGAAIWVIPADWAAPTSWQALPGLFRTDGARLELRQRLADLVAGPRSACRDVPAVEAMVRQDLADLHLSGWALQRTPSAAKVDGTTTCSWASTVEGADHTVLIGGGLPPILAVHRDVTELAAALNTTINAQCVALPEAVRRAQKAVTDAGFALSQALIPALQESGSRCTRATLLPSGLTVVVLRGPTE